MPRPIIRRNASPRRRSAWPPGPRASAAEIERNLIDWVPARETVYDRESFLRQLDEYRDITSEGLREHLFLFVREIAETAEEVGVKLAIHPDDPPFPLFGLPRVNSTQADTQKLFDAVPSPANGITLCTGSYGANPDERSGDDGARPSAHASTSRICATPRASPTARSTRPSISTAIPT